MLNLIQLIIGTFISSAALYYWLIWGQEVRTEFLPRWYQITFRTLPASDYVLTVIGSFLFLNGLLRTYRQYTAKLFQLSSEPMNVPEYHSEHYRENKVRQHLVFKVTYYPLSLLFIMMVVVGPFYKWSYLTSAIQEFFNYKAAGYTLGSPVWGIWIFSSWGLAVSALASLMIKRRLSLKIAFFSIPYFLNWGLFYILLRFDIYTHLKHLGTALSFWGVVGVMILSLTDHFLTKRV